MRKILLSMAVMFSAMSLQAQEYNMFNSADVDADGWLWFDTQEKVDKYVGVCNEDDYKVDPKGKLIQMVYADQNPTYPETTVDPTAVGYGAGGEVGATGAKTGAIILPAASANQSINGGGIAILMPSCSTFSMNVSCSGSVAVQLLSTDDVTKGFGDYGVRQAYMIGFKPFARAGNTTKTGLESLTNGNDKITIKSDKPVYVYFRNITKNEVYIHGIKVTTPKQEATGIKNVVAEGNADAEIYTLDGIKVANKVDGLKAGMYLVKSGDATRKVIVK